MPKVQFHEHVGAYAAISKKAPQGFQCLKLLLSMYDAESPNRMVLNDLLAPGFQDTENGSDRSISRDEAIDAILTTREKYIKHQFDLKHAYCLEHTSSHHTVFFESVRFLLVKGSTDWIKVPVSGRLEVKVSENRFTLKDAVAIITARAMTSDTSQLVARELQKSPRSPVTPAEFPDLAANQSTTKVEVPSVPELPAAVAVPQEEKPLPGLRPANSTTTGVARTPTVTSGSSAELDSSTKASWN